MTTQQLIAELIKAPASALAGRSYDGRLLIEAYDGEENFFLAVNDSEFNLADEDESEKAILEASYTIDGKDASFGDLAIRMQDRYAMLFA